MLRRGKRVEECLDEGKGFEEVLGRVKRIGEVEMLKKKKGS